MIDVTPHIPFVKSLATPILVLESFLSNLIASERKAARNSLLPHQQVAPPVEIVESQPPAEPENFAHLQQVVGHEKAEQASPSVICIHSPYPQFLM